MDRIGRLALTVLAVIASLGWSIAFTTLAKATPICPEKTDIYELALADTQGTVVEVYKEKVEAGHCADMKDAEYFRTISVYKDSDNVESRIVALLLWGQVVYGLSAGLPHGVWLATWRPEYANQQPEVQAWYKAQKPTPETLKAYNFGWGSCCDAGDACQECVVYRVQDKPPWKDGWYYVKDGTMHQLPPHIVDYVPWTPTGKPVLFIAPFASGDMKKGDPVCLKIPGGGT